MIFRRLDGMSVKVVKRAELYEMLYDQAIDGILCHGGRARAYVFHTML